MIAGILFYEKELEVNPKFFLWDGMKIFKKKNNCEVTVIALNKEQFSVDKHKAMLTLFEKRGITVLLLDDVNKNHYQVGRNDKSISRTVKEQLPSV